MLNDRIIEIKKEFAEFADSFMRYSFLVELSAYVSDSSKELLKDENLFSGCQSKVWITINFIDGKLKMEANSDTLLIRGILYVMMELYNNSSPEELLENPVNILEICNVSENFTSERSKNIQRMQQAILDAAKTQSKTS